MIVAIISIIAGAMGLTSLIDSLAGTELTTTVLSGIWSGLQVLLQPIVDLFMLIFDSILGIVRSFFSL